MVDRDWRGSFGDLVAVVGDYVGTFARAAMTWKRYDDYMARSIGQLARYAMEDVRECAEREKESMQWDWYVEDTMGGLIEPAAHILRGKHEAT